MLRQTLSSVCILTTLVACARLAPPPEPPAPVTQSARIAPAAADQPVAPGDCAEALRRAAARPDLTVDRLPSPVVAKPAPLQNPPGSALARDGSAVIDVDVLIDTLGKADMSTFTVVKSTSPWLTNNVRSVLAKWTFAPAQLAGCKVPRIYHFMASAPARKKP
jgi:hypothetical protein